MNLGRFHKAIEQVKNYHQSLGISAQLDQLIVDLNSLVNNHTNLEVANAFKSRLDGLKNILSNTSEDGLDGATEEVLIALQLENFVRMGLFNTIKDTIAENQLSPSLAAQGLTRLKEEIDAKLNHIKNIDTAFSSLSVEYEELDDEECELSVRIPVAKDDKSLSDLSNESKDWNFIIKTITEVFDPERPIAKIRTLSTGSWIFYLSSTPLVLWGFAITLKRVNQILTELIRMQELAGQLRQINAPTKEIENHQDKKFSTDIEILSNQLVNDYYKGTDTARKMELINATSMALKRLSRKIADGSKVTLRLGNAKKTKAADENSPTKEEEILIRKSKDYLELKKKTELEITQISYVQDGAPALALLPSANETDIIEASDSKQTSTTE